MSKFGSARTALKAGSANAPLPISRILISVTVGPRDARGTLPPLRRWALRILVDLLIVVHRNEFIERIEIVDVELPLQMIQLVLYGTRKEAVLAELVLTPVTILRLHPDAFTAADISNVARD
jgi:hypothetical protein